MKHLSSSKEQYQSLVERLDKEISDSKKNIFSIWPSLEQDIEYATDGEYWNLLPYASYRGVPLTLKDCNNYLEYYFAGVRYEREDYYSSLLSDLMYGEGSRANDMRDWMRKLGLLDTNGFVTQYFLHFELGQQTIDNNFMLSSKGIDFIEDVRHLYRTVGFNLEAKIS